MSVFNKFKSTSARKFAQEIIKFIKRENQILSLWLINSIDFFQEIFVLKFCLMTLLMMLLFIIKAKKILNFSVFCWTILITKRSVNWITKQRQISMKQDVNYRFESKNVICVSVQFAVWEENNSLKEGRNGVNSEKSMENHEWQNHPLVSLKEIKDENIYNPIWTIHKFTLFTARIKSVDTTMRGRT